MYIQTCNVQSVSVVMIVRKDTRHIFMQATRRSKANVSKTIDWALNMERARLAN